MMYDKRPRCRKHHRFAWDLMRLTVFCQRPAGHKGRHGDHDYSGRYYSWTD